MLYNNFNILIFFDDKKSKGALKMDNELLKNENSEETVNPVTEEITEEPAAAEPVSEATATEEPVVTDEPVIEATTTEEPAAAYVPEGTPAPVIMPEQTTQPEQYSVEPPKKKKFYKRWWFWLIVIVVIGFIAIGSSDSSSGSGGSGSSGGYYASTVSPYVKMVKNAKHSSYGITYGNAFGRFFSNTKWSHFTSTTGLHVVEFEGDFYYDNRPATAVIQFVVDVDGGTFTAQYLSINDVSQSKLMLATLINKAFESY